MNVFRLVLFLAGLAAYLLAKQFLPSTEVSKPSPALSLSPEGTGQPPVQFLPVSTRATTSLRADGLTVPSGVVGLRTSAE